MRDVNAQIEAAATAARRGLTAARAAAGSGRVEFPMMAEAAAWRMLAYQQQLDELRRNVVAEYWSGPGPEFIPAAPGEDGNRGILEDYLANGYVAHAAYHPFTTMVPQYPRRPGETWMDRKPMALAWATNQPERVVYFALCERPWLEGSSCSHLHPTNPRSS